jgi:uncharacterized protein YdeI (YjbR/CyaY-like superfamily)
MSNQFQFEERSDFRIWLEENCQSSEGIWILFGKADGPTTMSANDALEEALCYGWIDGQIKRIDDKTYLKYFAQRVKNSEWSNKNIKTAEMLEASGKMTDYGRIKIEEAIRNKYFKAKERVSVNDTNIEEFICLIKGTEPACSNYIAMSPSVKRTYALHYFDAKSDATRENRLKKILDRLNQNLKPM